MKVDAYQSASKPVYGLVVPTGAKLESFSGTVATAIKNLSPLELKKTNVDLQTLAVGDLLAHLQNQVSAEGAGLIKQEVSFTEVS